MTLEEIAFKYRKKMFKYKKFAIVKWLNKDEVIKYGVLFAYPETNDEGFGIALHLDEEYCPIVYPPSNKYEFVTLEQHHPNNNVFKKYNIFKESKNETVNK